MSAPWTTELYVVIPGPSQPQGSTRSFVSPKTGKVVTTSDNKRLKAWRGHAVLKIREAWNKTGRREPYPGAVRVCVYDYRLRPKRCLRKYPSVRTDIDKVTRSALDALTVAAVLVDDGQVCDLVAQKRYGPEAQVILIVTPMEEEP